MTKIVVKFNKISKDPMRNIGTINVTRRSTTWQKGKDQQLPLFFTKGIPWPISWPEREVPRVKLKLDIRIHFTQITDSGSVTTNFYESRFGQKDTETFRLL